MGLGNTKMKEIRFLSYLQGVQRSWKMDMVNSIWWIKWSYEQVFYKGCGVLGARSWRVSRDWPHGDKDRIFQLRQGIRHTNPPDVGAHREWEVVQSIWGTECIKDCFGDWGKAWGWRSRLSWVVKELWCVHLLVRYTPVRGSVYIRKPHWMFEMRQEEYRPIHKFSTFVSQIFRWASVARW
jgi:hypothetical protein